MTMEITPENIAGALAVSRHSNNKSLTSKYAIILSAMPLNVPLTAKEINDLLAPELEEVEKKFHSATEGKSFYDFTEEEKNLYTKYWYVRNKTFSYQQISQFGKFMKEVGYVKVEKAPLDEPYEIKVPHLEFNYETHLYETTYKIIKVDTITKYTRLF